MFTEDTGVQWRACTRRELHGDKDLHTQSIKGTKSSMDEINGVLPSLLISVFLFFFFLLLVFLLFLCLFSFSFLFFFLHFFLLFFFPFFFFFINYFSSFPCSFLYFLPPSLLFPLIFSSPPRPPHPSSHFQPRDATFVLVHI